MDGDGEDVADGSREDDGGGSGSGSESAPAAAVFDHPLAGVGGQSRSSLRPGMSSSSRETEWGSSGGRGAVRGAEDLTTVAEHAVQQLGSWTRGAEELASVAEHPVEHQGSSRPKPRRRANSSIKKDA